MEKRRFIRTDFDTLGTINCKEESTAFGLKNLSLKGALLEAENPDITPMHSRCNLQIDLENTDTIIQVEAELVHREGNLLGFRFTSIDVDSMIHLRRLMELNTANAYEISEELSFLKED